MVAEQEVRTPSLSSMAAEVLELGEALFDTLIEAAGNEVTEPRERGDAFPEEDLRVAGEEFFAALRALLKGV